MANMWVTARRFWLSCLKRVATPRMSLNGAEEALDDVAHCGEARVMALTAGDDEAPGTARAHRPRREPWCGK